MMALIGPFGVAHPSPGPEAVGSSPFVLRDLRIEMGFSKRNQASSFKGNVLQKHTFPVL